MVAILNLSKELGYEKDIYGNEIENNQQIIELKSQDLILPSCQESPNEGADKVLSRVASFIDDLCLSHFSARGPAGIFESSFIAHLPSCIHIPE